MQIETTFDNGSLGSRNDEERSEMRYVMWIAFRESSNLWTHIALSGIPGSMPVWEPFNPSSQFYFWKEIGFGYGSGRSPIRNRNLGLSEMQLSCGTVGVKSQTYPRKLPTVDNVRFSSPFTRPNLSWLTPTHFDMPGAVLWKKTANTWTHGLKSSKRTRWT